MIRLVRAENTMQQKGVKGLMTLNLELAFSMKVMQNSKVKIQNAKVKI